MQGLKNFIISESVKVSHAERYLSFLDRHHSQAIVDLRNQIEKNWRVTLKSLSKTHSVSDEAIQSALFRNPKASHELVLSTTPEKLITARAREPLEVSLSAKVPFVYSTAERHLITKHILDDARHSMEQTAANWREIFNYEHKGKIQPWFKILHDADEVRFQLAMGSAPNESYKTLYSVRIEYGKSGSKLKDFDRIYFTTLI